MKFNARYKEGGGGGGGQQKNQLQNQSECNDAPKWRRHVSNGIKANQHIRQLHTHTHAPKQSRHSSDFIHNFHL